MTEKTDIEKQKEVEELSLHPYDIARTQIGINEKDNPEKIRAYHKAAGIDAGPETSWCASFMSWCFMSFEPRFKNAWSKAWINFGQPTNDPRVGDLAVFERGTSGGHVGFFIAYNFDKTKILILGGNYTDKVCEHYYPASDLIGFRKY